jgi:hypothetical protein
MCLDGEVRKIGRPSLQRRGPKDGKDLGFKSRLVGRVVLAGTLVVDFRLQIQLAIGPFKPIEAYYKKPQKPSK